MGGREALLVGVAGWRGGGRRNVSSRSSAGLFFPMDCLGVDRLSGVWESVYERSERGESLGAVWVGGDFMGGVFALTRVS